MLEKIRDPNVLRIYKGVFLVGMAYGVSIALTPLHLDALGFGKSDIGTLAAWFASGIVLLSLPMGAVIRKLSARATLIASIVGYAVCVAIFPFLRSYAGIATARFFDGAFSVGIWVSCETILLSRAEKHIKAYVTSVYAMSMAIGYVIGPVAAKAIVAVTHMWVAFLVSGALSLISAAFLLARLDADVPSTHELSPHDLELSGQAPKSGSGSRSILVRIKTSCFATFAYGYFQASVVLFLPLFLIESKHIARDKTILISAFFATGMLLFSNLAGKLGDKHGHLRVMKLLAAVGTATVLAFVFLDGFPAMCIAFFVGGATLASISPVSLALQGIVISPAEYSRGNAIYNAFYAVGMLLGPPASSLIFARYGGEAMIVHLAVMWASFFLFCVVFAQDDPAARRRSKAIADAAAIAE